MANLSLAIRHCPSSCLAWTIGATPWPDYADKEAVAVVFTCNHCPLRLPSLGGPLDRYTS